MEELWEQYLSTPPYKHTIWSTMRICYVSVYNAYDHFIYRCNELVSTSNTCRTTDRGFNEMFRKTFGDEILDKCWTQDAIRIPRLVRHSLSHAGGRKTKKLSDVKHGMRMQGGVFQVVPNDIKALYKTLQCAATELVRVAREMKEFE